MGANTNVQLDVFCPSLLWQIMKLKIKIEFKVSRCNLLLTNIITKKTRKCNETSIHKVRTSIECIVSVHDRFALIRKDYCSS